MNPSTQPYIVPRCEDEVGILYRDPHLLVVNKPEFLLSIPGRHPLNKDCLITRLRRDYPSASIVHRLDLDTSGIMVIPLSKPVHSHISRQFQERAVEKSYHALVYGLVERDYGEIDLPIAPDWADRPRQKICYERGKNALTRYEVLERNAAKNHTRLLLRPVTGRSHQLRIHLRELGHPILGCDMYANAQALACSPRLLLHASQLGFVHPHSGAALAFQSPLPF